MKIFLIFLFLLSFSGCAPNLAGTHWKEKSSPALTPLTVSLSMTVNGDSVTPSVSLQNAYISAAAYPLRGDSCRLDLYFQGNVEEHYASWWYLGIGILYPFWPAMPRKTVIDSELKAVLFCNGELIKQMHFTDSDEIRLFWYGPYRSSEIQDFADRTHYRLIEMLAQSLSTKKPVESGIVSDY